MSKSQSDYDYKTRHDYDSGDDEYDRCRINPCLNSIITADSLFSSSFSSPCTSSLFGDSIGMESCVDVLQDADAASYFDLHRRRHRRSSTAPSAACSSVGRDMRRLSGEFPPPIPSLVRTENLQPRMPWVLRRHYTGDGRLVLTEEKAPRHEYFKADRSNGRLTLHLVTYLDHEDNNDHNGVEEDFVNGVDVKEGGSGGDAVEMRERRVEVSRRGVGGSGGLRCVEVGVVVPAAIRPVHS